MAHALRYKPFYYKIKLDKQAYADIDKVISAIEKNKSVKLTRADVIEIVKRKSGGIFEVDIRTNRIRARSGHTVIYNMEAPSNSFSETKSVPKNLYCIVDAKTVSLMVEMGGVSLSNSSVSLFEQRPRQEEGKTILCISAEKASKTGVKFLYDQNSNSYFCSFIPSGFLSFYV
jgi:RNA:NAD 2'-phosphotransferase (TPT1/KptA family)